MYTQILKEILLTIDFKQEHINEFLTYCREQLVGNSGELKNVEKLRKKYWTNNRFGAGIGMTLSFISCSIEHYV